ncbi:MAG: chromosome segregation protein SMC [Thermodesulfobacteriota bacterium]|nr:chromosome segregation protein SMC [Thermodesulfobacteriota bacterium]
MRLKKLELSGFKSFPEKSTILFPAGISSIVGPNGCGKSNIIDALRWVMGEQSPSQLRGKSMDDVIFAGTNDKAQLNMAEVSLTLANDNGSAPEELKHLTEINITRRLYRSGERAYYLNKQPCRLKDIYNIFLGSGMGARSYSIIQQGNIGAITDASPEERRVYIEEAAGVTRYKTRKEETLRKIKATNQDLLRIKDIIAEVEQRMNTLNRQAKKAQRYREYQAEKKELDILLSLMRHFEYTNHIDETDTLLTSLRDIDNKHASEIGRLDAAIEEIKLTKESKAQEISRQKEKAFELQRRIDKTENDLDYFRKDKSRLETETANLGGEKENLKEKNQRLQAEIQEAETQAVQLQEDNKGIQESLSRRSETAREIQERRETLNEQTETIKSRLMRLAADEARYNNTHQNAHENKESLKNRKKEIEKDRIDAARNATRLKNVAESKQEAIEDLKGTINDMAAQARTIEEKLAAKQQALTAQVKTVYNIEREHSNLKSRYSAIKKMNDNFEWYKDGVKAIMTRKEDSKGQESPVMGLMADIVKPAPGFETATEAVLGEALQYIMVDNHTSSAQLVAELRQNQSGRSGFVPVSMFAETPAPSAVPTGNTYERLIDNIAVEPGFEDAVHALIGHVALTPDLESAIALWHKPNGATKKTVVTRDGDLIDSRGIIVGGSKDRLAGILAKKQELKELEEQIAALDKSLATAQAEQKQLEDDVRELEEDLQKTRNDKNQAGYRLTEMEKEFYRVTEELKHARHRLEILELEEQQLDGEESEIDDEINEYGRALAAVRQEIEDTQAQLEETRGQVQSVEAEFDAFNQTTMDLKLKLTTSNAEIANNRKTRERLQQFQADADNHLEQLAADIAAKEEKALAAQKKIQTYEQTLTALYDELRDMEQTLADNESSYEDIAAKMAESDKQYGDIRAKRNKNVEKIQYLEMEQADRRLKRENIENRIEERYHAAFAIIKAEYNNKLAENRKTVQEIEEELTTLRNKIARIGEVNLGAIDEYEEHKERLEFLTKQHDDLVEAIDDLHKVIKKINRISQERFLKTFNDINNKMAEVFPRLFDGGTGELVLTEPDKPLETGVEMMVHPPGKKLTRLSLLSGGEKALSAIAFIFSIFLLKPTSFCLMDEIDAPLDEANVYRFNELLKIIGEQSQIVMVTHNKRTMEFADSLLGVTMEKKGVSKIVSVDLSGENSQEMVRPALVN